MLPQRHVPPSSADSSASDALPDREQPPLAPDPPVPPGTGGGAAPGNPPPAETRAAPPPTWRRAGTAPAPKAADWPRAAPALPKPEHWATAATLCQREADSGNVAAQRTLGTMYDQGKGVPEDPAAGRESYYQKASASDPQAMFLLSHLMESGAGTPRQRRLFHRAAAQGCRRWPAARPTDARVPARERRRHEEG